MARSFLVCVLTAVSVKAIPTSGGMGGRLHTLNDVPQIS